MNLDYLRYIIEVSKNNFNITNTATKLYISQPSLSQAIQKFEQEVGFDIFVRNNGRLFGLTDNGKVVIKEGQIILDQVEEFNKTIVSLKSNRGNTINIGISTPLLEIVFHSIIRPIIDKFGLDKINIIENTNNKLLSMFANREVDILFTLKEHGQKTNDIFSTETIELPFMVIMDPSHPLSNKDVISWEDLNDVSLILPTKGYVTEKIVTSKLKEKAIKPSKIINIVSVKVIENLIQDSKTITILPSIFLSDNNSLTCRPLEDKIFWTLEMIIHNEYFGRNNYIYNNYIDIIKLLRDQYETFSSY